MSLNKLRFSILILCLFCLVSCQAKVEPMTFQEIYPANLSDITKIEIRHGSGELKTVTDPETITNWLNSIKDIPFEPDENQESKVGYLYSVKLFEGDEVTIFFDTSKIDDFYYKSDNQMIEQMEKLFVES